MQLADSKSLITEMSVPYQAFNSKRSSWKRYMRIKGNAEQASTTLFDDQERVSLLRHDLNTLTTEPDLARCVMATIIWGNSSEMRGNNIANPIEHFGALTQLLSAAREQHGVPDWSIGLPEVVYYVEGFSYSVTSITAPIVSG